MKQNLHYLQPCSKCALKSESAERVSVAASFVLLSVAITDPSPLQHPIPLPTPPFLCVMSICVMPFLVVYLRDTFPRYINWRYAFSRYACLRYAFSRYTYLRSAFYHYAFLHDSLNGILPFSFGGMHSRFRTFYSNYRELHFVIDIPPYPYIRYCY